MEITNLQFDLKIPEKIQGGYVGGGWYFLEGPTEPFIQASHLFDSFEVDRILEMAKNTSPDRGRTSNFRGDDIRKSTVSWFYPSSETGWLFQKLQDIVTEANRKFFNFELHGFFSGLQFTKYESDGGHYTWHPDRGGQFSNRKLSMTIQLSDSDDYEGGDLEYLVGPDPQQATRGRGDVHIFPSFILHRVTPVTKGTRYSLVGWVQGPPFR
jgi:PKHD-type hydroxylase